MDAQAYIDMADTEDHHWWFAARRMILASQLTILAVKPKPRILEVGCGTGGNLSMLSEFGQVTAIEMSTRAREAAAAKTGHSLDIRDGSCPSNIPLTDEVFDFICLFDVLEHIDEDSKTLKKLALHLDDNGRIIITVPAYQWMWGPHDVTLHHKRRYTPKLLKKSVAAAGLRIERMTYFNMLLLPLAIASRVVDRLRRSTTASGAIMPPRPINHMLKRVFGFEQRFLRYMNFPAGLSIFCVVAKPL